MSGVSYTYTLADRLFDPLTIIQNDNGTSENKFTEDTLSKGAYVALSILLGCCLVGTGHLIYFIATKITGNKDLTTTKTAKVVLSSLIESSFNLNNVERTTRYLKSVLGRSLKFISTDNVGSLTDETTRIIITSCQSRTDSLLSGISKNLNEKGLGGKKILILLLLPSGNIASEEEMMRQLKEEFDDDSACPSIIILHQDQQCLENDYNMGKMEHLLECLH